MFLLGFIPVYILCKILNAFDLLRVPQKVELEGLDFATNQEYEQTMQEIITAERALVKAK